MQYKKADLFKRFLAALIDGIIASLLIYIPILGAIVSTVYLLTKDAIAFEITKNTDFKNRSIGKKIMGLEVVSLEGKDIDWTISVKRNLPIAIGSAFGIVPILGWIIGSIVGLVLMVVETVLAVTDNDGRRLGDRWANTQVAESQDLKEKDDVIDI
ncbi:MAG: RDD family protein [Tepidanaerobacter acetatoxydans]|uniref:RDD family protein n=1 Tax=Tepidanaerobacter acetatoxydans TaxID=499229 RepID=UPI0026EA2FB0|nr:RDD family protein [Tepidanaerobacter acetatoxydans]NLU09906.1 RDD family protein [Tepidanaerobacter acetatoxydans]